MDSSTNGSQPHDEQPHDALTDAEVEARMLNPALIAKGLEGASPELAVKILTDFKALAESAALRDQTQASDPATQIERESIKAARLMVNTLATIADRDEQVAWLAMRLYNAGRVGSLAAQMVATRTVGRMLDAQTPDDAHLDALADQLLKELAAEHAENVTARRQLVRRAFGVVLRRDEGKDPSTGQYL